MTDFCDMTRAHAKRVAEIEKATFASPWSEAQIAELADRYGATARVLEQDGEVVAYYSFYDVCGEGFVNNLAVAPEHRGKGLGNAIMRDMLYAASLAGITAPTLEVRESNAAARALYEKFGFKAEGVRKNFYPDKENAVIYWLSV